MVRSGNCASFTCDDVRRLLMNKFVVIIGDSIQRGIYKDIVYMLQSDDLMRENDLKAKGEFTFYGDELIEGGRKNKDGMNNGIRYCEVRQYHTETHLIRFYFITRCYNAYVESILEDLRQEPKPDLVIMNSCLWDMTRYGSNAINEYKVKLEQLMSRMTQILPPSCLFVWNTTMPISKCARGGFLVPEVNYRSGMLRLDVLEANLYAARLAKEYRYDVLDLHFYFRGLLELRVQDGIHWCAYAHRRITNILLKHVSDAWGFVSLPMGEITGRPLTYMNSSAVRHHPSGMGSFGGGRLPSLYSPVKLKSRSAVPYPLAAAEARVYVHNNQYNHCRNIFDNRYHASNDMNSHYSSNIVNDFNENFCKMLPAFDRNQAICYGQQSNSRYAEDRWFSQQLQTDFEWQPYASDELYGRVRQEYRYSRQHYQCPF